MVVPLRIQIISPSYMYTQSTDHTANTSVAVVLVPLSLGSRHNNASTSVTNV